MLKNKKILILGADTAIGKSAYNHLNKLGAKVFVDSESLDFDAEKIISQSVFFDNAKLDGMVYARNYNKDAILDELDFQILSKHMVVNFYDFLIAVKTFYKDMFHNQNSSIVAISNYASLNACQNQIAFAASKAALDNSMIPLAKCLFKKGIRINSIRPAIVDDGCDLSLDQEDILNMMQTGKIDPDILAHQIDFLLDFDKSSGVYGRCFDVRGLLQ